MRSHILGGEPKFPASVPWNNLAWLNLTELEERLRSQGDEMLWESIKGMFGVPALPVSDIPGVEQTEM